MTRWDKPAETVKVSTVTIAPARTDGFQLTWLADVVGLRVAVCGVAGWCVVGVRGQLVIQFLRAVDKNGQMLHLVTHTKKSTHKSIRNT